MVNKSFMMKNNSFDIIRYFSAISVMLLHYTCYAMALSEQKVRTLEVIRKITEIFPGVVILFSMSGFLISASLERCNTKKEYFQKRILRLYPELWLCTIVNLVALMVFARQLLDSDMIVWLCTQVVGVANTPSCLKSFATGSVNGALWTIFTEVQLYCVLGFTYSWLRKLSKLKWVSLLSIAAVLNLTCKYITDDMGGYVAKIIERLFFPYLIWFLIGVFCYQNREWIIPKIKKYFWFWMVIFLVNQVINVCSYGYYEDIITSVTLPFIVIGLAYKLPAIRIKWDLTYGIFLYHWIVLNVMVHLQVFSYMQWLVCVIIFIFITILTAWLSWYLVRKLYDRYYKKAI